MRRFRDPQHGVTIIEVLVVVAIVALLAAVAIPAYRDNTNRARMAEVVLALSPCKLAVADGWLREASTPGAGNWGCERSSPGTKLVGRVQTTEHGEIRVQVQSLASDYDGLWLYLKPYETATPPDSGGGEFVAGKVVRSWKCGVADGDSTALLAILPSSCRDVIGIVGTSWGP